MLPEKSRLLSVPVAIGFLSLPILGGIDFIYDAAAFAVGTGGVALALLRGMTRRALRVILPLLLLITMYGVGLARNGVDLNQGLRHVLVIWVIFGAIWFFIEYSEIVFSTKPVRFFAVVLSFLGIFVTLYGDLPKNLTVGSSFYIAATAISLLMYGGRGSKNFGLLIAFAFTIAFLSYAMDFRAMLGYAFVLILFCMAHMLWPSFGARLTPAVAASYAVLLFIFFMVINSTQIGNDLNYLIIEYTGRTAKSGREALWPLLVAAIMDNPLWGLGPDALPRDIINTTLSSHNFYLQITLQIGLMGLAALCVFIFQCYRYIAQTRSGLGWFSGAILSVFIMHNASEVVMLQNALMVALPAWIAIVVSSSFRPSVPSYEKDVDISARLSKDIPPASPVYRL